MKKKVKIKDTKLYVCKICSNPSTALHQYCDICKNIFNRIKDKPRYNNEKFRIKGLAMKFLFYYLVV
jgi:hypothetical protein